jgi:asparagine synthase (glutamine-hydrolysing)
MQTYDKNYSIVYNGELFNYRELRSDLSKKGYRFRTESDTEVVLIAYSEWGESCLLRFNGMFAFAIWDEKAQSLFCARDAVGVKPFYYSNDSNRFCFSSESKSLVINNTDLDQFAVASYFFSMYVPRQLSIYQGIKKLLPGHSLRVGRNDRVDIKKWWTLPPTTTPDRTEQEPVQELQALLDKAVKRQLQSDVPIGALLSGGFDSGMIVASAAKAGVSLHTYSVGFEGEQQLNELPIASAMAKRYGTIHREKVIANSEVMDMLDSALTSMSEPVADSAMVPTWCLSKIAAEDGVKVLLSGAGGDEVFAGYLRYVASSWRRRALYLLPEVIRKQIGNLLPNSSELRYRLAYPNLDMVIYSGGSIRLTKNILGIEKNFYTFIEKMVSEVYPIQLNEKSTVYKNMQFDLQVYLPDMLLMLLDQITMAHTIEGRLPLLDMDLIAASYALPSSLHADAKKNQTRKLMRRMAQGKLDDRTFNARKQGFSGPVRGWINANRGRFQERTMEINQIPGLESITPHKWWTGGILEQDPNWANEVFMMYCFSTWYQSHAYKSN